MNNSSKEQEYEIVDDGRLTVIGYVRRGATEGIGLQYRWDGTKLGIKREDEDDYSWVDLSGDGSTITEKDIITALGYTPANKIPMKNHINNGRIHVTEDEKYLITTIESKVSKEDIPTKLSDLEIDLDLGKNYDKEIKIIMETKADKTQLAKEVERLEDLIFDMSGGDLSEIESSIERLNNTKADKDELGAYMLITEYDKDKDGVVDKALDSEQLGGVPASKYALKSDVGLEDIKWEDIIDKPLTFTPEEHNHNDLYYTKLEVDTHTNNEIIHISQEERDSLNKKISDILKSIQELEVSEEDLVSIKRGIEKLQTSKLDIDTFNSTVEDLEDKISNIKVPTKVSELENDEKYLKETSEVVQIMLAEISTLRINKADRVDLQTEVDKLNKKIDAIDVPEGVDLTEVKEDIAKLKDEKSDITYVDKKILRLENIINEIEIPDEELKGIKEDIEKLRISKLDVKTFNIKIQEIEKSISEIKVPTKLSELENDTMFITKKDIPEADLTEIKADISALKINKADKVEVASEIARIEKVISDLDIPDEVDLQPILDNLNKLEDEKLSKVEFEARLSEEILNLIDNAPEALDTLGKLAQALGEDPEFATTITNLISQKADTSKLNIEVSRLDEKIDSIDIPEEVDLTPIKKDIEDIKQKDLSQDTEINKKANTSDISEVGKTGEYSDLKNTPKIPTKTSEIMNDSSFITIEDVPKVDLSEIEKDISDIKIKDNAQDNEIANKINKSEISTVGKTGKYSDLIDKPAIPSKVSQLDNDNKYITLEEVPETDLTEVKNDIKTLQDTKSEQTYVEEEITRVEEMITELKAKDREQDREIEDIQTVNQSQSERIDNLSKVVVDSGKAMTQSIQDLEDKKADKTELNKKVDKVSGKGLSTNDYSTSEKSEVATIKNKADKSYTDAELSKKVDKVTGKQLSTNDYTTAEKTKLAGISAGANKVTKVSELTNDTGFITLAEVPAVDLTDIKSDIQTLKTDKADTSYVNQKLEEKADKSDILSPYHLGETAPSDTSRIWVKGK